MSLTGTVESGSMYESESDCGGKEEFGCGERIVYVVSKIELNREKKS